MEREGIHYAKPTTKAASPLKRCHMQGNNSMPETWDMPEVNSGQPDFSVLVKGTNCCAPDSPGRYFRGQDKELKHVQQ